MCSWINNGNNGQNMSNFGMTFGIRVLLFVYKQNMNYIWCFIRKMEKITTNKVFLFFKSTKKHLLLFQITIWNAILYPHSQLQ